MIAIPAIDLKDGKVVRLTQGNFQAEKIYDVRPEDTARKYQDEGAERLHVVDLDGALRGKPANLGLVENILGAVTLPVQLGGGIRDLKLAESCLKKGVRWVILGTKACLDRGFLKEALASFADRVIIGIDARDGFVATDGWTQVTKIRASSLAQEAQSAGAETVIYTDIAKDGALQGPNLEEIRAFSSGLSLNVIASGGVGKLEDLDNIRGLRLKNVLGVVIGKALYENKFSLKEAVKACSQKE